MGVRVGPTCLRMQGQQAHAQRSQAWQESGAREPQQLEHAAAEACKPHKQAGQAGRQAKHAGRQATLGHAPCS